MLTPAQLAVIQHILCTGSLCNHCALDQQQHMLCVYYRLQGMSTQQEEHNRALCANSSTVYSISCVGCTVLLRYVLQVRTYTLLTVGYITFPVSEPDPCPAPYMCSSTVGGN